MQVCDYWSMLFTYVVESKVGILVYRSLSPCYNQSINIMSTKYLPCSQSNTLYFWKIFQNSINLTDFVRCSFNSPTLFSHSCPGLVGLALSYALSVTSLLSGVVSSFTETEKQLVSVERAQQYLNIPSENLQGSLLVNQSFLCRLN